MQRSTHGHSHTFLIHKHKNTHKLYTRIAAAAAASLEQFGTTLFGKHLNNFFSYFCIALFIFSVVVSIFYLQSQKTKCSLRSFGCERAVLSKYDVALVVFIYFCCCCCCCCTRIYAMTTGFRWGAVGTTVEIALNHRRMWWCRTDRALREERKSLSVWMIRLCIICVCEREREHKRLWEWRAGWTYEWCILINDQYLITMINITHSTEWIKWSTRQKIDGQTMFCSNDGSSLGEITKAVDRQYGGKSIFHHNNEIGGRKCEFACVVGGCCCGMSSMSSMFTYKWRHPMTGRRIRRCDVRILVRIYELCYWPSLID